MSSESKVEESRKTGGRKKGTPNKKTQEVIDRLKELNCDPIEGMAKIAMNACPCLSCEEKGFIVVNPEDPEDKEPCPNCNGDGKLTASLELRGQMYKELAQYVAPKRKAVEITGEGGGPIESRWEVEIKDAAERA